MRRSTKTIPSAMMIGYYAGGLRNLFYRDRHDVTRDEYVYPEGYFLHLTAIEGDPCTLMLHDDDDLWIDLHSGWPYDRYLKMMNSCTILWNVEHWRNKAKACPVTGERVW